MDANECARVEKLERASCWELEARRPSPAMAPFVHKMLGYTERAAGPIARSVMPCSKVMVVIPLGPPPEVAAREGGRLTQFDDGLVAGLDDAAGRSQHAGFQRGVRLDLTPQGARRLLGVPMSELSGRIVSLGDLLPASQRDLAGRLSELPSWDARFDLLTSLISARLAATEAEHEGVLWAAQRIEESRGRVDIGELVQKLGYSHKHTLRLFREHIGITPKLFARLVRFEHVRRAILRSKPVSLAELADRFGYSDQAHLVREVRHFASVSPTGLRLTSPLAAEHM